MTQAVLQMRPKEASSELPREDLYTGIHKAMRAMVCDTMVAAGRMDLSDESEVAQTLAQVRLMIELSRHHLHHENQHVHPAMEARRRGASAASAHEHTEHQQAFERLEALALRVERNAGQARETAALQLYREIALYAAHDLLHMHAEETANNALLWAHCSDQELKDIHHAILAAVGPRLMAEYLRWLAPSLSPSERAGMLSEMRAGMPSEVFSGVLELFRSVLGERDWHKVLRAARRAAAQQLMTR